jgi:hypothetical protein
MDRHKLPHAPSHLGVPMGVSQKFLSQWYVWREPRTYLALTQTLFPNGPK